MHNRVLEGILWFAILLGVPIGSHYYLWARLVRDTALPQPYRTVATVLLVTLAVGIPSSFFLTRGLSAAVGRVLIYPFMIWMGLVLYLFLLTLLADLGLALFGLLGAPADPNRRQWLARFAAGVVGTGAVGVAGLAMLNALGRVAVREVRIPLRRLPRALDGTTIVQITDTHIGHTIGRGFVERIVAQVNALAPDVVAITGDLVEGPVETLRELVAPLGDLRARHGVYYVTGNHEYYVSSDQVSGANDWLAELSRLGVRPLRNERVSIGDAAASFDLAGIDDLTSRAYGRGHGPDLARALSGRDQTRELVLLAHQPRHAEEAARHGVGLQLSGHTHGGQLFPFQLIVALVQPWVAGLRRLGDTFVYVSRGTGYFGPPMRLGAPAEITRVVLEAAGPADA